MSDLTRYTPGALGQASSISQEEAERLGDTLKAGRAENTKLAYAKAWRYWEEWCREHGHCPIPAEPDVLALYLSDRVASGRAINTARMTLHAVGVAHKLAGLPRPDRHDRVRETMAALRRRYPEAKAKPKHAVTAELLRKMLADLDPRSLRDSRNRAILLLGFSGAFRRSELAGLNVEDLFWVEGGLAVQLTHSKTNQEGATEWVRIGSDGSDIDPVAAVRHWLDKADLHKGPVFVGVHKSGSLHHKHITPEVINNLVRKQVKKAGLDSKVFGAHSLRAGFVTEAFDQQASLGDIMLVTRHRQVNQVMHYRRPPDPRTGSVSVVVRLGEKKSEK